MLQYPVRVDKPNPHFAKLLQQAIGGIEGEIRVCLQYLFQALEFKRASQIPRYAPEYRHRRMAHIEMLATAVALNLEGASADLQEAMAKSNAAIGAVMGGTDPRHVLSAGLGAMASDANGVPFNGSWVVSSGNIAADMHANVMAESTGRVLATRLYELTDDSGMKDMLSFLIARDTMHQNQWMAVLEELGPNTHPIPNSFPENKQVQDVAYTFFSTSITDEGAPQARWTHGRSIDGKGEFNWRRAMPMGDIPQLSDPDVSAHAQAEQLLNKTSPQNNDESETFLEKAADVISGK
jgi:Mn-containing catalase